MAALDSPATATALPSTGCGSRALPPAARPSSPLPASPPDRYSEPLLRSSCQDPFTGDAELPTYSTRGKGGWGTFCTSDNTQKQFTLSFRINGLGRNSSQLYDSYECYGYPYLRVRLSHPYFRYVFARAVNIGCKRSRRKRRIRSSVSLIRRTHCVRKG